MQAQRLIYGLALIHYIVALPNSVWADDDLFDIYMRYERAISKCDAVTCHREVLEEFSSRASQNRAEEMTEETLQDFVAMRRKMATDRVEKAQLYVKNISQEGNRAVLELGSNTYPGLTETVYFVREDGTWRIGKD